MNDFSQQENQEAVNLLVWASNYSLVSKIIPELEDGVGQSPRDKHQQQLQVQMEEWPKIKTLFLSVLSQSEFAFIQLAIDCKQF